MKVGVVSYEGGCGMSEVFEGKLGCGWKEIILVYYNREYYRLPESNLVIKTSCRSIGTALTMPSLFKYHDKLSYKFFYTTQFTSARQPAADHRKWPTI